MGGVREEGEEALEERGWRARGLGEGGREEEGGDGERGGREREEERGRKREGGREREEERGRDRKSVV